MKLFIYLIKKIYDILFFITKGIKTFFGRLRKRKRTPKLLSEALVTGLIEYFGYQRAATQWWHSEPVGLFATGTIKPQNWQ